MRYTHATWQEDTFSYTHATWQEDTYLNTCHVAGGRVPERSGRAGASTRRRFPLGRRSFARVHRRAIGPVTCEVT